MIEAIRQSEVKQQLSLANGNRLVLLDRLGDYPTQERARNIYLLDKGGRVRWRVHSRFDDEGHPFTRLHDEHGIITAYRWDGGTYGIDMETGAATPLELVR